MARLTAAARRATPASRFGLPAQHKFPMPDRKHAQLAEAFASRMAARHQLSPAQEAHIFAVAHRVLAGGS